MPKSKKSDVKNKLHVSYTLCSCIMFAKFHLNITINTGPLFNIRFHRFRFDRLINKILNKVLLFKMFHANGAQCLFKLLMLHI